ncbi:MAG: hypothetical protein K2J70_01015, partial [Muribaculaceae bacterium]|nr:hypothetical protein [Muribaculaceae bacterium]
KTAPHAYSVLNDWNQGYPLVQQQWHDMLKYWMTEYKVDGFRFDLVKGLGDNDSYLNNGEGATNAFNQSRVDRMKRLHDAMREVNPDAYFINENLAGAQEENDMAKDGELNWANVNEAGCQFAMGYSSGSTLNRMWAVKDGRTAGSTVSYLESHDEQRLAFKQEMWGEVGVKGNIAVSCRRLSGAAAQMILTPGSHMIWQFSEMGNAENTKSLPNYSGNNTDPKVVNWDLMKEPFNGALLKRYRQLIDLRLRNQDLFSEQAEYSLNFAGTGLRYAHSYAGDKEMHLFVNFSITEAKSTAMNLRNTDPSAYKVFSSSEGEESVIDFENNKVTVPANGYVVLTTNNVTADVEEAMVSESESMGVYSFGGVLHVVNAKGLVEVWNAAGMKVASSNGDLEAELPAGIYLVRNGGKTVKTAVK